MKNIIPRLALVCGIALAVILMGFRAASLNTLSHDDGISHLAATGHQERGAK